MSIKLKYNRPKENLIFSVKDLTDAYEEEMGDAIFYLIQDLNIATAQNNHNNLVQALNGLKEITDSQDLENLNKVTYKLLGLVDMDYISGD